MQPHYTTHRAPSTRPGDLYSILNNSMFTHFLIRTECLQKWLNMNNFHHARMCFCAAVSDLAHATV